LGSFLGVKSFPSFLSSSLIDVFGLDVVMVVDEVVAITEFMVVKVGIN
jgi:hypothetical protein